MAQTTEMPIQGEVVVKAIANLRQGAASAQAPILRKLAPGEVVTVVALAIGDEVQGNAHWFRTSPDGYLWSGACGPLTPKAGAQPAAADPTVLADSDYAAAATAIGCDAAAIRAVVATEVGIRGLFDEQGRPPILFERHIFHRLTGGKFDAGNPDISNPAQGGYGRFSEQYPKLDRALALDHTAALKSASWGAFQIMGENYAQAGSASVDAFVAAMKASAKNQLAAFVAFIKADHRLATALRDRNWQTFASIYNGPSYAVNHYDAKMKANYDALA